MSEIDKKSLRSLIKFETKSFSLLWRGSRDGFEASTFHRLCDDKANTLVLIKSINQSIFGGFTSIKWKSPIKKLEKTSADDSAFLFSLKNKWNNPIVLPVIKNNYQDTQTLQHAVFHSQATGPAFGQHFGGYPLDFRYDLFVNDRSNENEFSHIHLSDYENSDNFTSSYIHGGQGIFFRTEEIEVFEIY